MSDDKRLRIPDEVLAYIEARVQVSMPHHQSRLRQLRKQAREAGGALGLADAIEKLALLKRISAARAWVMLHDELLSGTQVMSAEDGESRRFYSADELR